MKCSCCGEKIKPKEPVYCQDCANLRQECKCLRCGHTWKPRAKKSKACPACHSPHWNEPAKFRGLDRKSFLTTVAHMCDYLYDHDLDELTDRDFVVVANLDDNFRATISCSGSYIPDGIQIPTELINQACFPPGWKRRKPAGIVRRSSRAILDYLNSVLEKRE